MKAVSGPLPDGAAWRFEPKWDGHRALVRVRASLDRSPDVAIASSSGADRTTAWPWLVDAVTDLDHGEIILDGEVIAIDEDGQHRFGLVGTTGVPHALVVFDVVVHEGRSLLDAPWEQRRAILEQTVVPGPTLIVTPTTDDGGALWEATRTQSFEGVVAKRLDSRYVPGERSRAWVKTKHRFEHEFLVVGWLPRARTIRRPGSLLLGVHDHGAVRFVGAAGSGLTDRMVDELEPVLESLATTDPVTEVPDDVAARARWVLPDLVVQIRHGGWTDAGRLRHAVVLGPRADVDPATVTAID